jgi:hypothetical protein
MRNTKQTQRGTVRGWGSFRFFDEFRCTFSHPPGATEVLSRRRSPSSTFVSIISSIENIVRRNQNGFVLRFSHFRIFRTCDRINCFILAIKFMAYGIRRFASSYSVIRRRRRSESFDFLSFEFNWATLSEKACKNYFYSIWLHDLSSILRCRAWPAFVIFDPQRFLFSARCIFGV